MSYSIKDLTAPLSFLPYGEEKNETVGLDVLAFWQAVDNICQTFRQNHMYGNTRTSNMNFMLGADISLLFVGWIDEIKFVRFRDQIGTLANSRSSDPRVTTDIIRKTFEIFISDLTAIQKLVLLDSLWNNIWGKVGQLKPVLSRNNITAFMPYDPIKLTIDEIHQGVGTAAFAKEHPSLSTLFSTYKMVSPIIANKHPELIESVDITLAQLVECENMLAAYQATIDLLDKIDPFRAKNPEESIKTIYKLDCDCHLNDYNFATEIIKFCLTNLYSVKL